MSQKHLLEPLSSVAPGENPKGMVAQTANETARAGNSEVNDQYPWNLQADGPRWNAPLPESTLPGVSPVLTSAKKPRRRDKLA